MKTPDQPVSFVLSLKREADRFAAQLALFALACVLLVFGWLGGNHLGWWGPMPAGYRRDIEWLLAGWLIFRALACLIDYTIYAVCRAVVELMAAALSPYLESAAAAAWAAGAPDRGDTPVSYLHDIIKRSKQATGSEPQNPRPAA